MPDKHPILIIDDDEALRETLADHLAEHGYAAYAAATLAEAEMVINKEDVRLDAIILDLGLPDGDGLDYCIRLRRRGHKMPIVILTGADGEDKVVQGLESGANDYITKPFRSDELAARLRAQLRLFDASEDAIISLGPFIFRPSKRQLRDPTKKGVIHLTDMENMILKHLHRAGTGVDRLTLLSEIWGHNSGVTIRALDTHIYRLRHKIEVDPSRPRLLVTNKGGYALQPEGGPTSGR
jgi:DNA-binding response OmpR family regulator